MLLGIALSLGLFATDPILRSIDPIRSRLQIPTLAVVPTVTGRPTVSDCGRVTHSDPMSSFAEAAKTVRSAIFFAGKSAPAKTILVTSPSPEDGRSVFSSNLAIALAQAGSRTLLVDVNFRNPSIPAIFEIARPAGLSDVLCGKIAVDRAIQRTAVECLDVLTCGTSPQSPENLLNSSGFSRLIDELALPYQHIVFDSPPVCRFADARILAASADLTVLVVRIGSTRQKLADRALEQLLNVGARVLGAVVNGVTLVKPLQRSRGILRMVEATQTEIAVVRPAKHLKENRGIRNYTASNVLQRTTLQQNIVPEVEVVD